MALALCLKVGTAIIVASPSLRLGDRGQQKGLTHSTQLTMPASGGAPTILVSLPPEGNWGSPW